MADYNGYMEPREYLLAAVGLLAVSAIGCLFLGTILGFYAVGGLIGRLLTRAEWARVVTLVIAAYAGFVGLLIALFGRGNSSLQGFVAALLCGAIVWLLTRPGMNRYFGSPQRSISQVLPVPPRPGALPHLQQQVASSSATVPLQTPLKAASTEEQWQRLQQQLRAEQEREVREEEVARRPGSKSFPWVTFVVTVLIYADTLALSGALGKLSLLIVVPLFVSAMLKWMNPRGVILGTLLLSGALVIAPEHAIVFSGMHALLQHQGPVVFAAAALLVYGIALCSSGFTGECENA